MFDIVIQHLTFNVKVMFADDNKNLFPLPLECREEVTLDGEETKLKDYLSALLSSYLDDGERPFCFFIREMLADGTSGREWLYYGDELLGTYSDNATEGCCRPIFKEQDVVHVVCDDYLTAGVVVSHLPEMNAYKLLIDNGDGMLSLVQTPSSRVLPIRWEYHLPRPLMGFLRQHCRTLVNK
ncbi:MAG: hypothetical protein E7127_00695 [Rikenellaceae bacterium]|nr:hypothetical protein [Rikenellaceae bacterium]